MNNVKLAMNIDEVKLVYAVYNSILNLPYDKAIKLVGSIGLERVLEDRGKLRDFLIICGEIERKECDE
jgi:hypothetical protein